MGSAASRASGRWGRAPNQSPASDSESRSEFRVVAGSGPRPASGRPGHDAAIRVTETDLSPQAHWQFLSSLSCSVSHGELWQLAVRQQWPRLGARRRHGGVTAHALPQLRPQADSPRADPAREALAGR